MRRPKVLSLVVVVGAGVNKASGVRGETRQPQGNLLASAVAAETFDLCLVSYCVRR